MEKSLQFLNFISYKYKINFEELTNDFNEFVKEERDILIKSNILFRFKFFGSHSEAIFKSSREIGCRGKSCFESHFRY